MDSIQIPDKTYFKIGEVAKLLDLEPYVLRYWETEFEMLKPEKTRSGQRAYRRPDIELLVEIKTLLYEEMYTIAGARRQLKIRKKGEDATAVDEAAVAQLREQIESLQQDNASLREGRDALDARAERLESQVTQRTQELEQAREQLRDEQARYDELVAERDALRDEVERLDQRSTTMAGQIELISAQAVDGSEVERLERRLADALERVDELERERNSLLHRSDGRSERQRRRLSVLRHEIEQLATLVN